MQAYEQAMDQLKETLIASLGERIDSIVLYGSAARGEYHHIESDIDIMIIGDDESKNLKGKISKIIGDIDLKYSTAISLVYLSINTFKRYLDWGSPFIRTVLEEGLIIYDRGIFEQVRRSLTKTSG